MKACRFSGVRTCVSAALVCLLTATCLGQGLNGVNLRVFKLADGLAESACMSVTVSPQEKVIIRHPGLAGVSEFGGYTITNLPSPGEGNNRIYGSPAGQLWTVTRDGLLELTDGGWALHPVPQIVAEFRTGLPRMIDPVPLCPIKQGQVLLLLSDRLLEFDSDRADSPGTHVLRRASQTRLESFLGMTPSRDGGLWIAGQAGLAKIAGPIRSLKAESPCQEYLPPESLGLRNLQSPHEDDSGGVTMVGESTASRQKSAGAL